MATARFDLTATITRSMLRSDQTYLVTGGRSIILDVSAFSTNIISGTTASTYTNYLTFEMAGSNRVVLQRRFDVNASKVITNNVLECRLSAAGTDAAPQTFTVSTLPVLTIAYLKLGILSDLVTVVYQVASTDLVFKEVTRRTASGFDFSNPGFIEVGAFRSLGDAIPSSFTARRVYGDNLPNPSSGGGGGGTTSGKSDTALHFPSTGATRIFPNYTGNLAGIFVVARPSSVTRNIVTVAHSATSQTLLDDFNRANAADIGASWNVLTTSSGAQAKPALSSNTALGSTSATTGATFGTALGSSDNGAFLKVTTKPTTAPVATAFNWLRLFVRASGSGSTLQAYMVSISIGTDGLNTWYISRFRNGSTTALVVGGSSPNLGKQLVSNGDSVGVRVVGSTIQAFYKSGTGAWTQVGTDVTDTGITTGTSVGFLLSDVSSQATAVDDFGGGTETASNSFPNAGVGGARYMMLTPNSDTVNPRKAYYYDSTLVPEGSQGGGTYPPPPAWMAAAVSRDFTTGVVSTRFWNPANNTFTHVDNAGTLATGQAISGASARVILGNRQVAVSSGSLAFDGDIAAFGITNTPITKTGFEALVQSPGVFTQDSMKALPGVQRAYDLTTLAAATDQIMDIVGTADEITGEKSGTTTIVTDTDNVPVGTSTTPPPPPPPPVDSVPDPTGFAVSNQRINTTDPTKGSLHLHVDAPVNSSTFTKNATPMQFYVSYDNGDTYTAISSWQSSTEFDYNNALLNVDEFSSQYYSVRYRDSAGNVGSFAAWVEVIISPSPTQLSQVTGVDYINRSSGTFTIVWTASPSQELITGYEVFKSTSSQTASTADWTGAGTQVVVNGVAKLQGPTFTGQDDLVTYVVRVRSYSIRAII